MDKTLHFARTMIILASGFAIFTVLFVPLFAAIGWLGGAGSAALMGFTSVVLFCIIAAISGIRYLYLRHKASRGEA